MIHEHAFSARKAHYITSTGESPYPRARAPSCSDHLRRDPERARTLKPVHRSLLRSYRACTVDWRPVPNNEVELGCEPVRIETIILTNHAEKKDTGITQAQGSRHQSIGNVGKTTHLMFAVNALLLGFVGDNHICLTATVPSQPFLARLRGPVYQ